MAGTKNEQQVLAIIEKYRCPYIDTAKPISSSDYQVILEHTIPVPDIRQRTGIGKSTLSDIIKRLADDPINRIQRFYFNSDNELLTEVYDRERHSRYNKLRVAIIKDQSIEDGQGILNTLGIRIVGSPEITNHISASVARPSYQSGNFKLHFVIGGYFLTIVFNKHIFNSLNSKPLILFIGQSARFLGRDSAERIKNLKQSSFGKLFFVPEQSHLEALGDNCIFLGLPNDSLYPPKSDPGSARLLLGNSKLKKVFPRPHFGALTLIIYPDLKVVGVSVMNNTTIPDAYPLKDKTKFEELTDTENFFLKGVPWPSIQNHGSSLGYEELEYTPLDIPDIFGHLAKVQPANAFWNHRPFPEVFSKDCWIQLENLLQNRNEREANGFSFIQKIHEINENPQQDLIQAYYKTYTGSLQIPSLLRFRRFYLMLSN